MGRDLLGRAGTMPVITESIRLPLMLATCSIILSMAIGLRHSFGLFLQPMSFANGWGREVFSLAVALQNLFWGLSQPFTGMLADRFGARPVLLAGGLLYAAGVACMAHSSTPLALTLSMGLLIGIGMSCTTYNIVFGALGRAYSAERRSKVLGICSAAGSFGQFLFLPLALALITGLGWYAALMAFAILAVAVTPVALGVDDKGYGALTGPGNVSLKAVLSTTFHHKGFWLLGIGYFTCGFQIVFVSTHFPAFLLDQGLSVRDGTVSLALIGLFNVFGSFTAGLLGSRYSKTYLLAGLYAVRILLIGLLLAFPVTPLSAYLFAAVFGFTWLATVPLTNGVVAGMFGVKHLATLSGFVFLFHQVGGFFGSWLGGYIFDHTGSYQIIWIIAIGLSVMAMLVNLPIDERPVDSRLATA
jgi:MFS family permease